MARPTTPSRTVRPARRRRLIGLTAATLGALAVAGPAAANPLLPIPPVAVLTATPNPVLVSTPPVAIPGPGPITLGTQVTFSAAGSFDPNGAIVAYQWDLDGAPGYERTTTTPTTTRRQTESGTLVVRVRVIDNQGLSAVRTLNLVRHRAPVPRITRSTEVAVVGDSITFDGSTSTDDGSITTHEWDLDDNGTFERSGAQVATSFGTTGTKTVRLRVIDNHNVARTTTAGVRIHTAPTASFMTAPAHPVAGSPATLDATPSSDDGTIARYEWDLDGDGTFETDAGNVAITPTTFTTPGTPTVGLRVTDNDGVSHSIQRAVEVLAPGATPTGPGTGTPPPPATPPAPATSADTTAPRMAPLVRRMKLTGAGRVNLRLRCPAREVRCVANLRLVGLARPLVGRRLGGRTLTVRGGRTATATVQLTPAARRTVRNRGSLRAQAITMATDAAGNRSTTRVVVTVRR